MKLKEKTFNELLQDVVFNNIPNGYYILQTATARFAIRGINKILEGRKPTQDEADAMFDIITKQLTDNGMLVDRDDGEEYVFLPDNKRMSDV